MFNSIDNRPIISVAVPVPLRQSFDFLWPEGVDDICVGARVKVPFGRRTLVGIVIELKSDSDYPRDKLKPVLQLLDSEPLFDENLWATLSWLASYYLAPIGLVIDAAIPVRLRQGKPLVPARKKFWKLSEIGQNSPIEELQRSPLQSAIAQRFMLSSQLSSEDFKNDSSSWRQAVTALVKKQWLEEFEQTPQLESSHHQAEDATAEIAEIALNTEQILAVDTLLKSVIGQKFSCNLLHGVTGSGKTEVYFEVMREVLSAQKQVLLLVPEIGLTPQLISRISQAFDAPITVMHSGLNETERHLAWWYSRQGDAHIVIGTRSAVFSPFKNLGLIVIDEEHDASFKQQDGVRYQARDVAIYRAKLHDIPIILGSATPSLESYSNALRGRYALLKLEQRATKAKLPIIQLFDVNKMPCTDGLSPPMLEAVSKTLQQNKQIMLFLNRRGYAPVLYCTDCGETSQCHRCDSHLTFHQHANRMRCHHCGYECRAIENCQSCGQASMVEVGEGTQRVEEALALRFPQARILRIDRDTTRRKGELEAVLEQASRGEADILLGTQLLTKGHDFPNVAMVGVLGADQGLYSTDFRSSEVMFQQILQVSGRAGRRDRIGNVYIQTAFVQHPFFSYVMNHDFVGFAQNLMQQRQTAGYPPFAYFALLRAESTYQDAAIKFLRSAKSRLGRIADSYSGLKVMDAIPAPMERRAGKYRAQLLLCSAQRSSLNSCLSSWLGDLNKDGSSRKLAASVRWSLDVDPFDHY